MQNWPPKPGAVIIDFGWLAVDKRSVLEQARKLGFDLCLEFAPTLLIPEQRVRGYCFENRCGNYGASHMCPPRVGSLEEVEAALHEFTGGVLLQYSRRMDVAADREEVMRTKLEFHRLILRLERRLQKRGISRLWGLIGGNCGLCRTCTAMEDKPCRHPDKARTSLEAIGVDVIALLRKLGLDGQFLADRITWTGCILFVEDLSSR